MKASEIKRVMAENRAKFAPAFLRGRGGMSAAESAAATGVPIGELISRYQSVGDNCEFGLMQRKCGIDPLYMLRFASIPLADLLRGLRTKFDGLGTLKQLEFSLNEEVPPQYQVLDKAYNLSFHTLQYRGEVDESKLLEQQGNRLKFLRRKLLNDIRDGGKTFVYKSNEAAADVDILALHAALNGTVLNQTTLGEVALVGEPSNTLLWVVQSAAQPAGTAELLRPGLVKGYTGRLAPYDAADDFDLETWLELCSNAYVLTNGQLVVEPQ